MPTLSAYFVGRLSKFFSLHSHSATHAFTTHSMRLLGARGRLIFSPITPSNPHPQPCLLDWHLSIKEVLVLEGVCFLSPQLTLLLLFVWMDMHTLCSEIASVVLSIILIRFELSSPRIACSTGMDQPEGDSGDSVVIVVVGHKGVLIFTAGRRLGPPLRAFTTR